jgi:hypothetical protein
VQRYNFFLYIPNIFLFFSRKKIVETNRLIFIKKEAVP